MAKTKNDKEFEKALNNVIEDLLKDIEPAMEQAVKYAVVEAKKDFKAEAESCLVAYYNEYPTQSYSRTNSLRHSFVPYEKTDIKDGKLTGSVGIQYSASALEKYIEANRDQYSWEREDGSWHGGYYGSRQDFFQPANASWVIENYLQGIHPTTQNIYAEDEFITYSANGQERKQRKLISSTYVPVKVGKSPNEKMDKFAKEYGKTFDENVLISLMTQIAKKLQ